MAPCLGDTPSGVLALAMLLAVIRPLRSPRYSAIVTTDIERNEMAF
jgi:hypothetical protein